MCNLNVNKNNICNNNIKKFFARSCLFFSMDIETSLVKLMIK